MKYDSLSHRIAANSFSDPDHSWNGTECWTWTGPVRRGSVLDYPYLTMREPGKRNPVHKQAHRVSWECANGRKMRKDFHARHLCNYSLCVNPDHVQPGTPRQNCLDQLKPGGGKYKARVDSNA